MEQRLSLVTLAPQDLARATAFYEALGWKPAFRNEEVSFFQLNGIVLSLWRRDAMAKETGIAPDRLGPGGMELAYNVREKVEVDRVVDAARAAGARVLVAPHETDWGGYSGHFADVEGFLWEIAWNPAWAITAEGNVNIS